MASQYNDYINLAKESYQQALDSISTVTKEKESDNALAFCRKAIMLEPEDIDRQKEVANVLFDITELQINIGTQVQHLFNDMTEVAKKLNEKLPLYSENTPINDAILDYWFKGIDTFDTILELCPTQKKTTLERKIMVLAETISLMFYTKSDLLKAFSLLEKLIAIIRKNDFYELDPLVEETLYNGGIEAGEYADPLIKDDKETASYLYDLAKNSLTEAQYRIKDASKKPQATIVQQFCNSGGVAKSLLSMLVRHYHVDPNQYETKLNEAKQIFEQLSTQYPNTTHEMYYNRACISAIENDVEEAIKYLELSRLGGYLPNKDNIQYDSDFDLIKQDDKFKNWLNKL